MTLESESFVGLARQGTKVATGNRASSERTVLVTGDSETSLVSGPCQRYDDDMAAA